jgi:hypothetical protein
VSLPARGRPPQAAARRAGLEELQRKFSRLSSVGDGGGRGRLSRRAQLASCLPATHAAFGEGNTGKDQRGPDKDVPGQRLAKDEDAEHDRHDGQQVGDGGCGGRALVGDEAVIEEVGDPGAKCAQRQDAANNVPVSVMG